MFDNLKNLAGLGSLMKNADQIAARFEKFRRELEETEVEAETGGGAVRAVVTCGFRVRRIEIDPAMMGALTEGDPDNHLMAESLITGAVNAALEKARAYAAEALAREAQAMGIPVPPGMGGLAGLLGQG